MTPRRRLLAALTAGLAGLALTGCERPAPIVTVVSGAASEWKEADVYCFEDQSFEDGECAERGEGAVPLEVEAGQQVGVDVRKAVDDRGWYLELSAADGQTEPQQSEVFDDQHYFAFTAPAVGPVGLRLTIRSVGAEGALGAPRGVWTFDLRAG